MYPPDLVAPMAQELTDVGFESLTTPDQVDDTIGKKGDTLLVVVNSVCGCAAANARPGAKMALQNQKRPDRIATVFAGFDKEATARAREYMIPYPPSSPSMALFKDGRLVHMLERHHIEGHSAAMIAENLRQAFDTYC